MKVTTHTSPIWSIPGFIVQYCVPDFMHTSCLGILQYLNGNVMWELFVELGGTYRGWSQACALLENMVRLASMPLGQPHPFHSLSIGMIRPTATGKPKMKLKAAEGRKLLPVLHYMWSHFCPVADAHSRMRLQCVAALLSLYSELDSWGANSP